MTAASAATTAAGSGKIHRQAATPQAAASAPATPQDQILTGTETPMERADKIIAAWRAGQIHYAADVAANVRPQELTLANFPYQKFVVQPGHPAESVPTEIVAKGEKPRYKGAVVSNNRRTPKEMAAQLQKDGATIHDLMQALFDQQTESVVFVLDGDNAAGKDGAIKHVFSLDPRTTTGEVSVKAPHGEEKNHGLDWRIMQHLPGPGQIGFFNRSAYGDIVFAPNAADRPAISGAIKEMEYGLTMGLPMTPEGQIALPDADGHIVDPSAIQRPPMRFIKMVLNESSAEQAMRLAERCTDEKAWKAHSTDMDGHAQHDVIQQGYLDAMIGLSTPWAPTVVIPSTEKPAAWWAEAHYTAKVLTDMAPHVGGESPDYTAAQRAVLKQQLLSEAEADMVNPPKHHGQADQA